MSKIIESYRFSQKLRTAKISESEALALGIQSEMETIASRAIAKERALANLEKDPDYYKKKPQKKTGT